MEISAEVSTEVPEINTAFDTIAIGPYTLGTLKPYLREIILAEIRQNGLESIRRKCPEKARE